MSLITDHDLLLIEPTMFSAAAAAATNLLAATDASVSGTTLTSASSNFAAAEIDDTYVALVNNEAHEIVQRLAATQLEVSRPRARSVDPKIGPTAGSGQTIKINSFERLIDQTQTDVLRALGVHDDEPDLSLDEDDIVNPEPLARLIALRVIERAFALAAALDPATASLAHRAALYAGLADEVEAAAAVMLDLDGDGEADAMRHLRVAMLSRR